MVRPAARTAESFPNWQNEVGVRSQTGHAKPGESGKKAEEKHSRASLEIINKRLNRIENACVCVCV